MFTSPQMAAGLWSSLSPLFPLVVQEHCLVHYMDSDSFDTEVRVQSLPPTPHYCCSSLTRGKYHAVLYLWVPMGRWWASFLSHECLLGRRDVPTWAVPLVEGGLIPQGWGDLRASQEGAINSQEGNILNSWVLLTPAHCMCDALESRACFAVCQGAAAAAPL